MQQNRHSHRVKARLKLRKQLRNCPPFSCNTLCSSKETSGAEDATCAASALANTFSSIMFRHLQQCWGPTSREQLCSSKPPTRECARHERSWVLVDLGMPQYVLLLHGGYMCMCRAPMGLMRIGHKRRRRFSRPTNQLMTVSPAKSKQLLSCWRSAGPN